MKKVLEKMFTVILAMVFVAGSVAMGSLTEGLVGYWTFDEGQGNNVLDYSGSGITGVVQNTANWQSGVSGTALKFQDADSWVILGDSTDLNFGATTDFTVSVWIKPVGVRQSGAIISNKAWNNDASVGWVIALRPATGSFQWNYTGADGGRRDFRPTVPVYDDQWHMITVSHDRDGFATFYFDGTKQDTMDISVSPGSIDTGYPIILGTDARAYIDGQMPPHWFDGAIDDVRIYNYALSDVEIAELYVDFNPEHKLCLEPLQGDLTGDCVVGLDDFAIFAAVWLECNLIPDCY